MAVVSLIIAALVLAGLVLSVHGTIAENRWGINLGPVACPKCGQPRPMLRLPRSIRQAVWGGHTCPSCGCEVDKWGREVKQD